MGREQLEEVFPLLCFDNIIKKYNITVNNLPNNKVMPLLNEAFSYNWSYEIKNIVHGKTKSMVTVKVILPGTSRDGVGFNSDVNEAIYDAIRFVIISLLDSRNNNVSTEPKIIEPIIEPKVIESTTPIQSTGSSPSKTTTINTNVKKFMDVFKLDEETASQLVDIYKEANMTEKSMLLKYVQSWNSEITNLDEVSQEQFKEFINWMNKTSKGFDPEGEIEVDE